MVDIAAVPWDYVYHPLVQAGFLACLSIVIAVICNHTGVKLVRRTLEKSEYNAADDVADVVDGVILYTAAGIGLRGALAPVSFPESMDIQAEPLLGALISTVLVVVWARALLQLGTVAQDHTDPTPGKHEFVPIFVNIWTVVVLLGGGFALLGIWGIDLTPLLASAGLVGMAVGFAARETVANFFGSLALYFDDTFTVGDYIKLQSGQEGWVTDITIRSTVLRTFDDELVTVPNSQLNSTVIVNQSEPDHPLRIRVPVGVAYGTDIDALEEILLEIAEDHERVEDSPNPRVRFSEFGDSAVKYNLIVWAPSPGGEAFRLSHELNQRIYKRLNDEGIEIPFPQQDVHLQNAPGDIGSDASAGVQDGK